MRKTAALCVAKLYDLTPQLAIDNGFVATLQDLLSDPNPMVSFHILKLAQSCADIGGLLRQVIANAVAALTEINDLTEGNNVFVVNTAVLSKLLSALNDCTEWGQICILNTLAEYIPVDSKEAETIVERVMPRLQHANPSVVLSAVRVRDDQATSYSRFVSDQRLSRIRFSCAISSLYIRRSSLNKCPRS